MIVNLCSTDWWNVLVSSRVTCQPEQDKEDIQNNATSDNSYAQIQH